MFSEALSQVLNALMEWLLPIGNSGWGLAASLAVMALTAVWVVGLSKHTRKIAGHNGGFAIMIPIGLTIITFILTPVLHLMRMPLIHLIPTLGLLVVVNWLFGSIIRLIVRSFASGIYRFLEQIALRPMKSGYSNIHVLAGALMIGAIINLPILNQATYFIPSVVSCLLGLYTLVFVRPKWKEILWETRKKYVVEYGELPYGLEAKTAEDARLLREACDDLEAHLSGETLQRKIEKSTRKMMRIEKQLELFADAHHQKGISEDEAAERLAELEARLEEEAEAEEEVEVDSRHLHK